MFKGIMSFWIGGGILSFVEIIQLGFDITRAFVNYLILKRQTSNSISPSSSNKIN
jgi:hypothetical protein